MSKKWVSVYNNSLENFNSNDTSSFKKFLTYLSIMRMPYEKPKKNAVSKKNNNKDSFE